uniref:AlNc14C64G4558 protein n=1 Tax=Albugo laibachii Nc14 TaxID=890382 RepID=F0WD37_9STRA|nr:AlNc14C64G4558 [Albugo laibachii Nc14]|eukprot:CCA19109.1 AlNc14C64G4558 [Albugo laibachii Nc14]
MSSCFKNTLNGIILCYSEHYNSLLLMIIENGLTFSSPERVTGSCVNKRTTFAVEGSIPSEMGAKFITVFPFASINSALLLPYQYAHNPS